MKKEFLIIVLMLFSSAVFSQLTPKSDSLLLNSHATLLKHKYPESFETIKANAIITCGAENEMVESSINNQATALLHLLTFDGVTTSNLQLLSHAVFNWTQHGCYQKNLTIVNDTSKSIVKRIMLLNVDWEMVKYEYAYNVKAKESYEKAKGQKELELNE